MHDKRSVRDRSAAAPAGTLAVPCTQNRGRVEYVCSSDPVHADDVSEMRSRVPYDLPAQTCLMAQNFPPTRLNTYAPG